MFFGYSTFSSYRPARSNDLTVQCSLTTGKVKPTPFSSFKCLPNNLSPFTSFSLFLVQAFQKKTGRKFSELIYICYTLIMVE